MEGSTTRHPTKSLEEIQARRKREDARCRAEAGRIQREQIVRGFEDSEEIRGLWSRIVALRHECKAQVTRVQRKWERARAIERGEVAMVEEDGKVMGDSDTDYEMEESEDGFMPTQVSLTTEDDNDNEQWQQLLLR